MLVKAPERAIPHYLHTCWGKPEPLDSVVKRQGNINNVELVGETGLWYFPVNKNCTVVYGDSNA